MPLLFHPAVMASPWHQEALLTASGCADGKETLIQGQKQSSRQQPAHGKQWGAGATTGAPCGQWPQCSSWQRLPPALG